MNNTCPTCGALYNVAAKDIGRKLKCKKCSTSLTVTEAGLVLEDANVAPVPDDDEDNEPVVKKKKSYSAGSGRNPIAAIGGFPTILFGFGVFLVIVFTSFPIIGRAGTDRAAANVDRLNNERDAKLLALVPKGKKPADFSDSEKKKIQEDGEKIQSDYVRLVEDAKIDAKGTEVANRRDVWLEQWGLMFGFIFVSFGCIGYLRTEQPLIMRIVAGTVLTFTLMMMLMKFAGCAAPR